MFGPGAAAAQDQQRQSSRVSSRNTRNRTTSITNASVPQPPPSMIPRSVTTAGSASVSRPSTSTSSTAGSHGNSIQSHLVSMPSPRTTLAISTADHRERTLPSPSPTLDSCVRPKDAHSTVPTTPAGGASSLRRTPSFSLSTTQDLAPYTDTVRTPSSLLPPSTSRSGIPRLGDTLLRKLSPSGSRVVSDNVLRRSPRLPSTSKLPSLDNQTTSTGLLPPRLRPSPSEGSLFSATSSPSSAPLTMGPPQIRPSSNLKNLEGMARADKDGSGKQNMPRSPQPSADASVRARSPSERGPSGDSTSSTNVPNSSKVPMLLATSKSSTQRSAPPPLAGLDPSLHSLLFDGDDTATRADEGSLLPPMTSSRHPTTQSQKDANARGAQIAPFSERQRPDVLGRLSSRKPDLHLVFDEQSPQHPQSQATTSRFSAFSSAHNTPADEAGGPAARASYRSRTSAGEPSPALSAEASVALSPANELSYSLAGLGLGGLTSGSTPGVSSISSSPVAGRSHPVPTNHAANLRVIPQTPVRGDDMSPNPSPSGYDRAGQIGIGELSTPRWNFPSSAISQSAARAGDLRGAPQSVATKSGYDRHPPESPTAIGRNVMPVSSSYGHNLNNSAFSASSSAFTRQREAEAKRHSRAISLSASSRLNVAHRSPSGPAAAMPTSPSVPATQFGGLSTISSLKRDFGQDPGEYIRKLHEMSGGKPNSPPYSISAVSDSESGLDEPHGPASEARSRGLTATSISSSDRLQVDTNQIGGVSCKAPSPRLADLAWSGEETGPFVVAASERALPLSVAGNVPERRQDAESPPSMDPFGISENEYRSSFNLNSAIADLLRDDEERRQRLKDMRVDSDVDSARASVDSKAMAVALIRKGSGHRDNAANIASPLRSAHSVDPEASGGTRTRHVSSPGQVLGSPSVPPSAQRQPRQSSTSGQQRANRASKRLSSMSIGHSLLRGTMPFGGTEGLDSSEAAEQLRRLDGMTSRKRSSSRERPSQESATSTRSPRTSKAGSRPGSASKGASALQGRPASSSGAASSNPARAQRVDAPFASKDALGIADRQRSVDELRGHRTSKTLSRSRADEYGAASLYSPKTSLDSPQLATYTSPRVKKAPLPPLPTQTPSASHFGNTTAGSSPGTAATSKRTSAVSIASRDSLSKEPITPSTTASRLSTSSKNKRASDASSHFSSSDLIAAEGGEGEDAGAPAAVRSGAVIPPVPPLPKVWGTGRSQPGGEISASVPSPPTRQPVSAFEALELPISFSLRHDPLLSTARASVVSNPAALSQERKGADIKGGKSYLQSYGHSTTGDDKPSPIPAILPPLNLTSQPLTPNTPGACHEAWSRPGRHSRGDGMMKASPMPAEDQSTDSSRILSGKSTATTPPSPVSARRTPSFFRRRSDGTALLAKEATEVSTPSAATLSFDSPRSQVSTSGRSSRKSILGLGNLLRNSAARKSMQVANKAGENQQLDADLTAMSFTGSEKSGDPTNTPTKAKVSRRGSLIGRKRGKTLPSATDPPIIPSPQLPPLQIVPLPASPALSAAALKGSDGSPSQEAANRRQLTNSQSVSNLMGRSTDASYATMTSAQSTAQDRRSTELDQARVQNRERDKNTHLDQTATHAQSVPGGSRIPRPAGSIRRTMGRLAPSNASGVAGSRADVAGGTPAFKTSTTPKNATPRELPRVVMGQSTGGMTKSYTTSSLASNFGIRTFEEDTSSLAGSEATLDGKSSSRRPSLIAQESSSTSNAPAAPPVSSAVQLILNAYNAAKTQSDIDGVLRRARITAYSSNLSGTDREVLGNLISRHETPRHGGERDKMPQMQVSKAKVSELLSTPSAAQKAASPAPTPNTTTGTQAAATPSSRRPRTSILATSSNARSARHNAIGTPRGTRMPGAETGSPSTEHRPASIASDGLDPDERQGDEEMAAYIRRSHAKKLASGVSQKDLDELLEFPEPVTPSRAYSPRQAEALYSHLLSDYELQEMFEFKEIYFVGNAQMKMMAHRDRPTDNYGYDDERGDYNVVVGDHLAYRYEIMGTLGRGSFGQVLQCKDHKTGRSVAVKLIRNKKRFHHQALVEIKILQNLVEWDPEERYNVIKMTDHFHFRNHLCISMELLSINLYELIKANSFAGFSTGLIRRFTSQVLLSLSLMKQHKVVHCDLKPENILLMHPRKSGIKVIDFGSSCFEYEKVYTYIQSRFYRSPEVILGMNYHAAIDIWSLGCILAELYTGFPLFPGENEQEQLACIMEVVGVPDRYLVERSTRKKLFFDSTGAPRPVVNSKGKRRRPGTKTLAQALKCNEEPFVDFLTKCLLWDPERRIKPDAAMRHPWIRSASGQRVMGTGLALTPGHHARQSSLSGGGGGAAIQAPSTTGAIRTARAGDFVSSIPSSMPRPVAVSSSTVVGGSGHLSTRRTPVYSGPTSSNGYVGGGGSAVPSSNTTSTTSTLRRNQQPVS